MLRALLKQAAPVVAATVDARLTADVLHTGKTALMLAAFKHFTQGVKLLLEEGGAWVVGWFVVGYMGMLRRVCFVCVGMYVYTNKNWLIPPSTHHQTEPHQPIKPSYHAPSTIGANPYVTDDRGRTALDLVCFLGRNDKVRAMEGMLLVSQGGVVFTSIWG